MKEIAESLALYGPWGVCAFLTIAVAYLFKAYSALQKELRDTIQVNLRDTLSVVESTKQVLAQTAEAVREQKIVTENLREVLRILQSR